MELSGCLTLKSIDFGFGGEIASGDGATVDGGGDGSDGGGGSTITVGGLGTGAGAGFDAGFSCSPFTDAFVCCTLPCNFSCFRSIVGGSGFFFGLLR